MTLNSRVGQHVPLFFPAAVTEACFLTSLKPSTTREKKGAPPHGHAAKISSVCATAEGRRPECRAGCIHKSARNTPAAGPLGKPRRRRRPPDHHDGRVLPRLRNCDRRLSAPQAP